MISANEFLCSLEKRVAEKEFTKKIFFSVLPRGQVFGLLLMSHLAFHTKIYP